MRCSFERPCRMSSPLRWSKRTHLTFRQEKRSSMSGEEQASTAREASEEAEIQLIAVIRPTKDTWIAWALDLTTAWCLVAVCSCQASLLVATNCFHLNKASLSVVHSKTPATANIEWARVNPVDNQSWITVPPASLYSRCSRASSSARLIPGLARSKFKDSFPRCSHNTWSLMSNLTKCVEAFQSISKSKSKCRWDNKCKVVARICHSNLSFRLQMSLDPRKPQPCLNLNLASRWTSDPQGQPQGQLKATTTHLISLNNSRTRISPLSNLTIWTVWLYRQWWIIRICLEFPICLTCLIFRTWTNYRTCQEYQVCRRYRTLWANQWVECPVALNHKCPWSSRSTNITPTIFLTTASQAIIVEIRYSEMNMMTSQPTWKACQLIVDCLKVIMWTMQIGAVLIHKISVTSSKIQTEWEETTIDAAWVET